MHVSYVPEGGTSYIPGIQVDAACNAKREIVKEDIVRSFVLTVYPVLGSAYSPGCPCWAAHRKNSSSAQRSPIRYGYLFDTRYMNGNLRNI